MIDGKNHQSTILPVHQSKSVFYPHPSLKRWNVFLKTQALVNFFESPPRTVAVEDLLSGASIKAYIECYNQQFEKCVHVAFGKTPQFWALYMMMVDCQQKFNYAINHYLCVLRQIEFITESNELTLTLNTYSISKVSSLE